jgi:hypothetical protein
MNSRTDSRASEGASLCPNCVDDQKCRRKMVCDASGWPLRPISADAAQATSEGACHPSTDGAEAPAGWKLVPATPTEAMLANGKAGLHDASFSDFDATDEELFATWIAMLAASPPPPAAIALSDEEIDLAWWSLGTERFAGPRNSTA